MSTSSSTRPAAAERHLPDRRSHRQPSRLRDDAAARATGVWGPTRDHDESVRVLRRARRARDHADRHGRLLRPDVADDLVREALHPYPPRARDRDEGRTDPFGARAVGGGRASRAPARIVRGQPRRLGLETIELFQLHRIDPKVPADEQFGMLKELQDEGKIQHAGLSEVSIDEIEAAGRSLPIVTVQNQYNLVDRQSEDVLEYCEREGIGFIPWFPIASGRLAEPGRRGGRARGREGRDARPDRARLAARALARDAADPRDVEGRTPRGELRGCARAADASPSSTA